MFYLSRTVKIVQSFKAFTAVVKDASSVPRTHMATTTASNSNLKRADILL